MMNAELPAADRCRILRQRLKALNQNTAMDIEDRIGEIRRAEKALMLAQRDLEAESRHLDKVSRAVKPLPSEADRAATAWQRGMNMERRKT